MKINKALVKHEARNMKWMLLYFLAVSIGGLLAFNSEMSREYMDILRLGINPDRTVVLSSIRTLLNSITVATGIGIVLMVYLQFKDSKSIEVGNFLKALPINNKEYYITKLVGGLISLTIPTIILIVGVLVIRSNNMAWVIDIQSISMFPEMIAKAESVTNIMAVLVMGYLVAVATYSFLFMIQYVVMNITAGIVIGGLIWLSPTFILISLIGLYDEVFNRYYEAYGEVLQNIAANLINYIEPWSYTLNVAYVDMINQIENSSLISNIDIMYYEGVVIKIVIALIMSIISISLGYILSKKSRVEDHDKLITFKWARKVFIMGVTVCSGLLLVDISQMFLGLYGQLNMITLHVILIIGSIIGYIVSKKITYIENK